jgi:hypothetical protein
LGQHSLIGITIAYIITMTKRPNRPVVSFYRLTSRKICADYPELTPLIMQRDSAIDAVRNVRGFGALNADSVLRRIEERVRIELDARYDIIG